MNLQYISDSNGNTAGVYIPINEWNSLKDKYKEIENEAADNVLDWHEKISLKRIAKYKNGQTNASDFDDSIDEFDFK